MKGSLKQNQISTMNDKNKSDIEATLILLKRALLRDDVKMLKILNIQLYNQIGKIITNYGRV